MGKYTFHYRLYVIKMCIISDSNAYGYIHVYSLCRKRLVGHVIFTVDNITSCHAFSSKTGITRKLFQSKVERNRLLFLYG